MDCATCEKRATCKEICEELKKVLKDSNIYSAGWIRPERYRHKRGDKNNRWREIPVSNEKLDALSIKVLEKRRGRMKPATVDYFSE